jgi:hypothetical protein
MSLQLLVGIMRIIVSELSFDPTDPFPLLSGERLYSEAQKHSAEVDAWLGLKTNEIEESLLLRNSQTNSDTQHWIGLPSRSLLTPYTELRSILSHVSPSDGDNVVDLGAGYGRLGFVLARHYPAVDFIGYEIVNERVAEASRCFEKHQCHRAIMLREDLSAPGFVPVSAAFYFLYDYGSRTAVVKTLNDLRTIAQARAITVIGRGRLSRDLIERENPWLSQVNVPSHHRNFSIYRS